jgi:hypothetical protein
MRDARVLRLLQLGARARESGLGRDKAAMFGSLVR